MKYIFFKFTPLWDDVAWYDGPCVDVALAPPDVHDLQDRKLNQGNRRDGETGGW